MNIGAYRINFDALFARLIYPWRYRAIALIALLLMLGGLGSGLIPPLWKGRADLTIAAVPEATIQAVAWTAEDRALAVAGALAEVWADEALHSPIVAIDTASVTGSGQVLITIDQHPDEEQQIVDLPDLLIARRPAWRTAWRRELLEVHVAADGPPPIGGPLIAPVLTHGRGAKTTRFYPLASWRHLGLYGGGALGALHAMLGSLLYP